MISFKYIYIYIQIPRTCRSIRVHHKNKLIDYFTVCEHELITGTNVMSFVSISYGAGEPMLQSDIDNVLDTGESGVDFAAGSDMKIVIQLIIPARLNKLTIGTRNVKELKCTLDDTPITQV